MSIFGKAVNYHHDDKFVIGFRKANSKIHGNIVAEIHSICNAHGDFIVSSLLL